MPAKNPKPRIAIYLKPQVYDTVKRLSELNGEPMSRIVAELVEAVADSLMRTVALLEVARNAPQQVKDGLRGTFEAMERELYGVAGYAQGQMDWLIEEMGKTGRKGKGGESERAAKAAAASPPSGSSSAAASGESNPHNVIRGSGLAKSLKDKGSGVSKKKPSKGSKNG